MEQHETCLSRPLRSRNAFEQIVLYFFYYNLHVIRNSRSEHSEFGSIRDEKIHRVTHTQSKLANQLRHSQFQHHSLWAQRY